MPFSYKIWHCKRYMQLSVDLCLFQDVVAVFRLMPKTGRARKALVSDAMSHLEGSALSYKYSTGPSQQSNSRRCHLQCHMTVPSK